MLLRGPGGVGKVTRSPRDCSGPRGSSDRQGFGAFIYLQCEALCGSRLTGLILDPTESSVFSLLWLTKRSCGPWPGRDRCPVSTCPFKRELPVSAPLSSHRERELTQVLSLTTRLDLALIFGPLAFQQRSGCIASLASRNCWSS